MTGSAELPEAEVHAWISTVGTVLPDVWVIITQTHTRIISAELSVSVPVKRFDRKLTKLMMSQLCHDFWEKFFCRICFGFNKQRKKKWQPEKWGCLSPELGGAACYKAPCTERPLRLLGLTAAAQFNENSPPRAEGRWVNPERNKGGQRVQPLLLRNNPLYYTHPFGSFGRPWQDESKVYSKKARAVPAGSSRVS